MGTWNHQDQLIHNSHQPPGPKLWRLGLFSQICPYWKGESEHISVVWFSLLLSSSPGQQIERCKLGSASLPPQPHTARVRSSAGLTQTDLRVWKAGTEDTGILQHQGRFEGGHHHTVSGWVIAGKFGRVGGGCPGGLLTFEGDGEFQEQTQGLYSNLWGDVQLLQFPNISSGTRGGCQSWLAATSQRNSSPTTVISGAIFSSLSKVVWGGGQAICHSFSGPSLSLWSKLWHHSSGIEEWATFFFQHLQGVQQSVTTELPNTGRWIWFPYQCTEGDQVPWGFFCRI